MTPSSDRKRIIRNLRSRLDSLSTRDLILFGGKGGVGKTTLSLLAAIHFAESREVTLITTDPAGNLQDFGGDLPEHVRLETIDPAGLWKEFLDENLESLLELGDRGTYLDRDELRRFFELSIPGVDELMGWSHVAAIVGRSEDPLVIVDTAPTGHTLRLLSSAGHWHAMELVLESMQEKHREIVSHLTRRDLRDALDDFLERFSSTIESSERLFGDDRRTAFVPVLTPESWVVDQTVRLAREVSATGIGIPFAILNHAAIGCDCDLCDERRKREETAAEVLEIDLIRAPRACGLFRSIDDLETYISGELIPSPAATRGARAGRNRKLEQRGRLVFVAGKGGVGKTTIATSLALRAANEDGQIVLLSVDPAHSVTDVFARFEPPSNLRFETIDTRVIWKKLEGDVGESIRTAISGLTPKGFHNVHDEAITQQLLEISPPGADEIFALIRILELWHDRSLSRVVIDTAPTGHFLRLLDLPRVAGEWIRELMRITLRYRELLSSSSIGEKLLNASRSLREFEAMITDPDCVAVVVCRPEPIVVDESLRLLNALEQKALAVPAVVVNGVTPENDCRCDARARRGELAEIERLGDREVVIVDRRDRPPETRSDLEGL